MSHLMNTYARLPVGFTHGEGVWLYDEDGKRYLDALAGIAVNQLGHAHPRLVEAIASQAGKLIHTSNIYRIPLQERLANRLAALAAMDEAFFCNSGAEANETAIKLARFYGHTKEIAQPAIIVMEHAFHGRTLATLSATGNRKVQAGFEPLVSGFVRVPYNDIEAVRHIAERNQNVVAVMLEILQGEGGLHMADDQFMQDLRQICDERGWLMICDEIQCGMARTGKWFGWQNSGVKPDIMSLAKGLGGGVPIGACLASGKAAGLFGPGNHGSTFGGNPLACAAALATIDTIESENLLANVLSIGNRIRQSLATALQDVPAIVDIRGQGLMIGVELDRPCGALVGLALEAGLLINVTSERVIRLLPPLVMSEAEADELVSRLASLVRAFMNQA